MTPDTILAGLRLRFRLLTSQEIDVMRKATWEQVGEAVSITCSLDVPLRRIYAAKLRERTKVNG